MTDWKERAERAEAELARLRAQKPAAWVRQYHHSGVLCWENEGGNCAPLYRAAPPAQPAEPVQRLSDERAAFEAWHNEYRTQELVRRDDTYYNTHVRCRWEGWQARAIESALQPAWRDIESAPKDGRVVLLGKFNSHNKWRTMRGQWFSADAIAETWEDPDDAPEGWYETSVEAEDMPNVWYTEPTHWMPLPPAPKATK